MNHTEYLISCIKREVPQEVILQTFCRPSILGILNPSIDHLLRDTIVLGWVLPDTNCVAGIESIVDLSTANFRQVEGGSVVNIPMHLTAGREITTVLSMGYGTGYNNFIQGPTVASALLGPIKTTDSRVQLLAPNTVFIESNVFVRNIYLRCVLENDTNFNNISMRLLPLLSDLCVLATKAHAYNKLVILLSTAVMINGVDMSKLAEVVNGYADSITMYKETLRQRWGKATLLNDAVSRKRNISMIVPH